MRPFDRADPDHRSVAGWLSAWEERIEALDPAAARDLFDPGTVSFGTLADLAVGLDALERDQWRRAWISVERVRFSVEEGWVLVSGDRCQAAIVTMWSSTGVDEAGERFERPGRATIVLRRDGPGDDWAAVHTHFSMRRGVRAVSHASRGSWRS